MAKLLKENKCLKTIILECKKFILVYYYYFLNSFCFCIKKGNKKIGNNGVFQISESLRINDCLEEINLNSKQFFIVKTFVFFF